MKNIVPLILLFTLLVLVTGVVFARPVFWSVIGCFNAVGEGQELSASFERFPVYVKKYTIKYYGEIMPKKKIMNIISDESEDYEIRETAVSVLPSDDESVVFLEKIFWEVEDELSYRILQRLWVCGAPAAEEIADEILTDFGKYGPIRICAALIAKENELRENNCGRSDEELAGEMNSFKEICADIRDNYDRINKIDRQAEDYSEAHDPVKIAGYIFNDLGL